MTTVSLMASVRRSRRFTRVEQSEIRVRSIASIQRGERETWFLASGPLDDSATTKEIPPVKAVQALIDQVGAKGHVTFAGRLLPDAKGFPTSAMAKKGSRCWRDARQVRAWVGSVAEASSR